MRIGLFHHGVDDLGLKKVGEEILTGMDGRLT